jgi:hypothetical protein
VPQIIETTVYRLFELSPAARENACSWYRQHALTDDWYDSVFDDFGAIATLLGLQFKTRTVRLFGVGPREIPQIFFSGFSSQGDGACFEAIYRYAADAAVRSANMHRSMSSCMALPTDSSTSSSAISTS